MSSDKEGILWGAVRLLCPLFSLALGACGGGGGGGEAAPPQPIVQRVWQKLPGGIVKDFRVCASGIVRTNGTVFPITTISHDRGMTWQSVDLGGANVEFGDSSYYWRQGRPGNLPPSEFAEETRDCGVTWKPFSLGLQACTHGRARGIWHAGELNQTLYAQYIDPDSGQFFICTSSDEGQNWMQGPVIPALVGEVRRRAWFAWQTVAPAVPGGLASHLLLRSNDQGMSWQSDGLRSSSKDFPTTNNQIRIGPSPPVLYLIATTQVPGAEGQSDESLWRWDDAAAAWTAVPAPLPSGSGRVWDHSPAVNPANPQQVFIITYVNVVTSGSGPLFPQRIFETRDAGHTWLDVTDGLSDQPFGYPFDPFLVFDPTPTNQLYKIHFGYDIWALDTRN